MGLRKANKWGLWDMTGNVWEWCWEAFESVVVESERFDTRKGRLSLNPIGSSSGHERITRGGAWNEGKAFAYLAFRHREEAIRRSFVQGFRIVRTIQKKE